MTTPTMVLLIVTIMAGVHTSSSSSGGIIIAAAASIHPFIHRQQLHLSNLHSAKLKAPPHATIQLLH